jgi:DNA-binding XRE family transcriptional regulator
MVVAADHRIAAAERGPTPGPSPRPRGQARPPNSWENALSGVVNGHLSLDPAVSIVAPMPDVGSLLKSEIRRLAKKEARLATAHAHRRVAQHRRDIAKLRRLIQEQAARIMRLEAAGRSPAVADAKTIDLPDGARFSARSLKAQRNRLGLSAALYGKLVGVSGQTVYSWEHNHSRPRPTQMAAWFASRSLSKQQAMERIGVPSDRRRTKRRRATKAVKRRRRS